MSRVYMYDTSTMVMFYDDTYRSVYLDVIDKTCYAISRSIL